MTRILAGIAAMGLLLNACSSGVDEERVDQIEADVADIEQRLDERADPRIDDLEERLGEVERERDDLRARVAELEERLPSGASPDGEIEPWPASVVNALVEGCAADNESQRPFCECFVGELQDTLPLADFLVLSVGTVEGDFSELFRNPAFADALGACAFLAV